MVIPAFTFILLAVAFTPRGRRQLQNGVNKVIGVSVVVGGISIPLIPILGVVNLLNCFYNLEMIHKLTSYQKKLEEEGHHHDPAYAEGTYIVKLYANYRNMVMNIACCLLVFQMYITTNCYKSYIPLSEEVKKLNGGKKVR